MAPAAPKKYPVMPDYHRRSIRLEGYDYSQTGAYFVTICTNGRLYSFGQIAHGTMQLNGAGMMVEKWWGELTNKYPLIDLDAHVVMPNHFHGIIMIVGAAPRGRPKEKGHPRRGAPTLGDVVGWFKTMTTNEYISSIKQHGWPPFHSRLWQRNYYEHVIRDERSLQRTREYVETNPERWHLDRENPHRTAIDDFDTWLKSFKHRPCKGKKVTHVGAQHAVPLQQNGSPT